MSTEKTDREMREKVWDMIRDIKTAMLVTQSHDGRLCSRPMRAIQTDYNGELWFFTRADSSKVQEIQSNENVLLVYSEPDDQSYVNINGTADISHDRNRIKELWAEPMRTWFPQGPEDPQIALIRVIPDSAEYWDSPSSAFVYAYGYIKARLTGQAPNPGDTGAVKM